MIPVGKALVIVGLLVALLGILIWGGSSIPTLNRLGSLPGDVYVRRGNFMFYFPITTAIVLSIAISLILALLRR
jgi:hypothetical protein